MDSGVKIYQPELLAISVLGSCEYKADHFHAFTEFHTIYVFAQCAQNLGAFTRSVIYSAKGIQTPPGPLVYFETPGQVKAIGLSADGISAPTDSLVLLRAGGGDTGVRALHAINSSAFTVNPGGDVNGYQSTGNGLMRMSVRTSSELKFRHLDVNAKRMEDVPGCPAVPHGNRLAFGACYPDGKPAAPHERAMPFEWHVGSKVVELLETDGATVSSAMGSWKSPPGCPGAPWTWGLELLTHSCTFDMLNMGLKLVINHKNPGFSELRHGRHQP